MTATRSRAETALRTALRLRSDLGQKPWEPICVFDAADQLGLEVRFTDIDSLEGAYIKGNSPVLLISAHRPPGRQAFTCAHEVGHHSFAHGSQVDEVTRDDDPLRRRPGDEYLADTFASYFLMPKAAVLRGFAVRGWDAKTCRPEQIYVVARWLGVSYAALVNQMCVGLHLFDTPRAKTLSRCAPTQIRKRLLGVATPADLVVVDKQWDDVAVDLQVGDLVMTPTDACVDGTCIARASEFDSRSVVRAMTPGLGRLCRADGWAVFVRVSRRHYVGRNAFRFLPEVD